MKPELTGDVDLDLDAARMVSFGMTPNSPQAQQVINRVLESIQIHEVNSGTRQRARTQKALVAFKIALAGIVGAAVIAIDDFGTGLFYRSMAEARWRSAEEPIGYDTALTALRGLECAGLITKVKPGCFYRSPLGGTAGQGKAARWQPTPALLSMLKDAGIIKGEARHHFAIPVPWETIVVRGTTTREFGRKINGQKLPCPDTHLARSISAEVAEINDYLSHHKIDGAGHDGYRRVFNNGDQPSFAFNYGGRLQSVGGNSYQNIPSIDRLSMTIDGDPVVEIDIRACQLSILHAEERPARKLPRDLYAIDRLPREVVKSWITVTLGLKKIPAKWPVEVVTKLVASGIDLDHFPIELVSEIITDTYGFLKNIRQRGRGTVELTAVESNIIVATLLRLHREFDAPVLAMHDGIIVKAKDEQIARQVLEEEFQAVTRVKPVLTVKRT